MKSVVTILGVVVLGLTSLFSTSAAAQNGAPAAPPAPQVRFDQFVASVKGPNGKLVPKLTAKDFVIEEGGEKQSIVGFSVGAEAPISLAILLDLSGDMAPYLGGAKGAAAQLLIGSLSGRDEYAMLSFDTDVNIIQDFGPVRQGDDRKVINALQPLKAKGPTTALYNIVSDAVSMMKKAKHERRALVVLTSSADRDAGGIAALKRAAAQYNVSVYAIGYSGTIRNKEADTRANQSFNSMSRSSSGLSDLGLRDVAGGLQQSRGGMGGGGFGGGGMGGMGGGGFGGGGMGGMGGGGFGGQQYNNPYGNSSFGGNNNCNNTSSPFGNNNTTSPFGNNNNTSPFGANSPFGNNNNNCNSSPFGTFNQPGMPPGGPPQMPSYGNFGKSIILENMVATGAGQVTRIDLSFFETDAGTSHNAQQILDLSKSISDSLRGQYTLGYYTTRQASLTERGLIVKTITEGQTVDIEAPKPPEPVAAVTAAKVEEKTPAKNDKSADKGKTSDKQDKDKKNKK